MHPHDPARLARIKVARHEDSAYSTTRTRVRILVRMQHAPWSPPLVEMSGGQVGHLLEWRQHERDGSWHAWVSWVLTTSDPPRHQHKVVSVQAGSLAPLEAPDAYRDVPRRVLGNDGKIRPWSPALDAQRPGRTDRSVALLRKDDGLVRVASAEVGEHRSLRRLGVAASPCASHCPHCQ
jgi:hypothetical protein